MAPGGKNIDKIPPEFKITARFSEMMGSEETGPRFGLIRELVRGSDARREEEEKKRRDAHKARVLEVALAFLPVRGPSGYVEAQFVPDAAPRWRSATMLQCMVRQHQARKAAKAARLEREREREEETLRRQRTRQLERQTRQLEREKAVLKLQGEHGEREMEAIRALLALLDTSGDSAEQQLLLVKTKLREGLVRFDETREA